KYDFMAFATGACHTSTPSASVRPPPMIVPSHAVIRRTASMKIKPASGASAIATVSHSLPVGFRLCSNIPVPASAAKAHARTQATHILYTLIAKFQIEIPGLSVLPSGHSEVRRSCVRALVLRAPGIRPKMRPRGHPLDRGVHSVHVVFMVQAGGQNLDWL